MRYFRGGGYCCWKIPLGLYLLAAARLTQVSDAKGGGGGGFGGGGRGRRSPPLYQRTSLSSAVSFTLPPLRRLNPLGYHNVPEVGEVISVLVNTKEKTYVDGNVTMVLDGGSQFIAAVDYGDGVENNILYFHLQGQYNLYQWLFLALFIFLCWSRRSVERAHEKRARAFDATFTKELAQFSSRYATASNPPISGSYLGFTSESNFKTSGQRVDVELEFGGAGLISGRGTDATDGDYVIKGNYSKTGVKWTEYYDGYSNGCILSRKKGYTVTVRGTYKGGRRFVCFYRSSRGIIGEVTLGKKKVDVEAPEEGEPRAVASM
jgi:hypothetical protein